jgi:hypothetical protein
MPTCPLVAVLLQVILPEEHVLVVIRARENARDLELQWIGIQRAVEHHAVANLELVFVSRQFPHHAGGALRLEAGEPFVGHFHLGENLAQLLGIHRELREHRSLRAGSCCVMEILFRTATRNSAPADSGGCVNRRSATIRNTSRNRLTATLKMESAARRLFRSAFLAMNPANVMAPILPFRDESSAKQMPPPWDRA